jgi:hypothetical protein
MIGECVIGYRLLIDHLGTPSDDGWKYRGTLVELGRSSEQSDGNFSDGLMRFYHAWEYIGRFCRGIIMPNYVEHKESVLRCTV